MNTEELIENFEFLDDILLIFTTDPKEPIIAYSLKTDGSIIENVSNNNSTYIIEGKKINLIGNNEEVSATFNAELHL